MTSFVDPSESLEEALLRERAAIERQFATDSRPLADVRLQVALRLMEARLRRAFATASW